jgi:hypothetical protein
MHRCHALSIRLSRRALVALIVCLPSAVAAQHGGNAGPAPIIAPKEGAQFDFLVGQWELTGQPLATTLAQRLHGVSKLPGTWKAWRAFDGWGLEDELRLTDASGNPVLFTHTTRYYNSAARQWTLTAIDVYKGITNTPTAEWRGSEMTVSGSGKEPDGRAYISRGTYSKITPTSFTYRLDRSYDSGKKWTEGITRIDAKRVAATAPR